jgi:hypothetical protein
MDQHSTNSNKIQTFGESKLNFMDIQHFKPQLKWNYSNYSSILLNNNIFLQKGGLWHLVIDNWPLSKTTTTLSFFPNNLLPNTTNYIVQQLVYHLLMANIFHQHSNTLPFHQNNLPLFGGFCDTRQWSMNYLWNKTTPSKYNG